MGGVLSTTSDGYVSTQDSAEHLLGEFIGGKSYPLGSKQWQQLFELPLDRRWQRDHIDHACEVVFGPSVVWWPLLLSTFDFR